MKVWLVFVFILFGLAEFYEWASSSNWLQQIALLPTPILFAAGFVLAIASNAKKHLPWQPWPPSEAIAPTVGIQPQPSSPPTVPTSSSALKH